LITGTYPNAWWARLLRDGNGQPGRRGGPVWARPCMRGSWSAACFRAGRRVTAGRALGSAMTRDPPRGSFTGSFEELIVASAARWGYVLKRVACDSAPTASVPQDIHQPQHPTAFMLPAPSDAILAAPPAAPASTICHPEHGRTGPGNDEYPDRSS
jgi:hypothetical protein